MDDFPSFPMRAMGIPVASGAFPFAVPAPPRVAMALATACRTCLRRQQTTYETRPNMPITRTPDSPNTMLVVEIGTIAPGGSEGEGGDASLGGNGGRIAPGGKGGGLGLGDGGLLGAGSCGGRAGGGECGGGSEHSGMMPHVWSNTSRFLPELSSRQSSGMMSM
jgi:hypothetical protein